jgi:hypothetical protein
MFSLSLMKLRVWPAKFCRNCGGHVVREPLNPDGSVEGAWVDGAGELFDADAKVSQCASRTRLPLAGLLEDVIKTRSRRLFETGAWVRSRGRAWSMALRIFLCWAKEQ